MDSVIPSIEKTYPHTNTYTWLFVVALFVIAKFENNSNVHQQINGQTNRGIYI